jgi:arylsulfatase A-like enzyme
MRSRARTFPEEVNGVKQIPLEGKSLVYTFDNPKAPTRHTLQYFTTSGNRGIYKDGWWAGDRFHSTWEPNYIHSMPATRTWMSAVGALQPE